MLEQLKHSYHSNQHGFKLRNPIYKRSLVLSFLLIMLAGARVILPRCFSIYNYNENNMIDNNVFLVLPIRDQQNNLFISEMRDLHGMLSSQAKLFTNFFIENRQMKSFLFLLVIVLITKKQLFHNKYLSTNAHIKPDEERSNFYIIKYIYQLDVKVLIIVKINSKILLWSNSLEDDIQSRKIPIYIDLLNLHIKSPTFLTFRAEVYIRYHGILDIYRNESYNKNRTSIKVYCFLQPEKIYIKFFEKLNTIFSQFFYN